jgi:hypothetical protein
VQNANTRAQKIKASGKLSDLYVQNRKNVGRVNNLSFEDIQKFKNLRKEVRVKTGAIKRKRKNMPQVDLKSMLKEEKSHGHKTISVQLAALKPSQRDFNYKKVNGMAEALENGEWT